MKVLLIDDDQELLELLKEYLTGNGLEVLTAASGARGLEILAVESPDLVVLDIMMPEMSGLEVLKLLTKEHGHIPVVILSARGDDVERILGLELGADDYVVKPFNSRELLARINAIIRRGEKLERRPSSSAHGGKGVQMDFKSRHALVRGVPVKLSSIEFDILSILVQNEGIVLSRERIMDLSRGREFIALDRSIDIQISRLRQKLEKNPQEPALIKTVWGIGYLFTGEGD